MASGLLRASAMHVRSLGWLGVATTVLACSSEPALEVGPASAADEAGGKADGPASKTELKITLDPADIRKARYRLDLWNDESQERRIWFYDTPALALYDAGTILRAREIAGEDDDTTVKLRPFTFDELASELQTSEDLKCEIDRLPDSATSSCSIKVDRDEGDIAAVDRGSLAIDALFSDEQHAMFTAHGPAVSWDRLVALGPISARVWELRSDALPEKVTAELWYMPDGTQTLELSMKVKIADGDDGMEALLELVDDRELRVAAEQESKTRRALEALAGAGSGP